MTRQRNIINELRAATVPAVLEDILRQLCSNNDGCDHGKELSSLEELRLTILEHFQHFDQVFLVVDGVQCLRESESDLEREICWLQKQVPGRLNVLLTSRGFPLPDTDMSYFTITKYCDGDPNTEGHDTRGSRHGAPYTRLPFFWVCRKHGDFALCRACYEKNPIPCFKWYGLLLDLSIPQQFPPTAAQARANSPTSYHVRSTQDERSDLWQPYQHRYIDLNRELSRTIKDYLSWNMQSEHGGPLLDLQDLEPDSGPVWEQRTIANTNKHLLTLQRLNNVDFQANGNIALARLRMDMLHIGKKYDPVNGLPDPVVVMFEAVISGIRGQVDETWSRIGLWSLVIVSEVLDKGEELEEEDEEEDMSCPWEEVKAALKKHMSENEEKYSVRDVLHAAHGVLLVECDEKLSVTFYNNAFRTFVFDIRRELRLEVERCGKKTGAVTSSGIKVN